VGSRVQFENDLTTNRDGARRVYCKVVAGSAELLCGFGAASVGRTEHAVSGGVDYWIVDEGVVGSGSGGLVLRAVLGG
jgi:hypothetical protein